MRKLCFNKPLLFSLITAFLFLQWSATHIHLADEHAHDNSQHLHALATHQHQLADHHADIIDSAAGLESHADSSKVVELEYACTQFHDKLSQYQLAIRSGMPVEFDSRLSSACSLPLYQQNSYQNYHQYTLVRLRAPPATS